MERISNECLEYIRDIPRRYEKYFGIAKEYGYSDELCSALAYDKIGKDALDAVNLFLMMYDDQEDDLK